MDKYFNENINFYELFDKVRTELKNNNKEYQELYSEYINILESNYSIQKLIDDEVLENGLSSRECSDLVKLIFLHYDLQEIAEKEIYLKCSYITSFLYVTLKVYSFPFFEINCILEIVDGSNPAAAFCNPT